METSSSSGRIPTTTVAPGNDGLSTNTIIIIVGAISGSLFLLVIVMLCVLACIFNKNSKRSDDDETPKSKNRNVEYVDRIFRPVDWENPEQMTDGHDIAEIDLFLMQESRSRRGSIAIKNPAFREDDDNGNARFERMSNGHAHSVTDEEKPPRPPNLSMLPPERRQSSKSVDSSKPRSPRSPTSPTSPIDTQISILDKRTWGAPDRPFDHDDYNTSAALDGQPNTVSGPHNDPAVDFSVFGAGNMRGSVLQENTLRRSLRSKSQAIVDFYESGYSNSSEGRSTMTLPMSRMDYQVESDDRPTSDYGTGSRMLWQKRKFESFQ